MADKYVLTRVEDIKAGDIVDLYGDKYADPDSDPGKDYAFTYHVVSQIVRETMDCIRLDFEDCEDTFSVGFPLDHELKIRGSVRRNK